MRLYKLIDNDKQINEGLLQTLFFIKHEKTQKQQKPVKKNLDDEPSAPFGGVCKYKKSILIPENPILRKDEGKLIKAAAQMFRGNWVNNKDAQSCLKAVLSHLLKTYLEDYTNHINTINMAMLGDSLVDGQLKYASSNEDFRMVQRVFNRIMYHKNRIFNDMINNPGNFENKWKSAKEELSTVIENVLKTGGDVRSALGISVAAKQDALKKK